MGEIIERARASYQVRPAAGKLLVTGRLPWTHVHGGSSFSHRSKQTSDHSRWPCVRPPAEVVVDQHSDAVDVHVAAERRRRREQRVAHEVAQLVAEPGVERHAEARLAAGCDVAAAADPRRRRAGPPWSCGRAACSRRAAPRRIPSARVSSNGARASSAFAIVQRSALTSRSSGRYDAKFAASSRPSGEKPRDRFRDPPARLRSRIELRRRRRRRPAAAAPARHPGTGCSSAPRRSSSGRCMKRANRRARASQMPIVGAARQRTERRRHAPRRPRRGRRSAASAAPKAQVAGKQLVAAVAGQRRPSRARASAATRDRSESRTNRRTGHRGARPACRRGRRPTA